MKQSDGRCGRWLLAFGMWSSWFAGLASCSDGSDFPCPELGAPRVCGEVLECSSACGLLAPRCDGTTILRCNGDCFERVANCKNRAACEAGKATGRCADSLDDCEAIRAAYAEWSSGMTTVTSGSPSLAPGVYGFGCSLDDDCRLLPGHCDAGLDTCWLLGRPRPILDELAALFQELGCAATTTCDCPPAGVSGVCTIGPEPYGHWESDGVAYKFACVMEPT
jgi:hypothetical protein